MDLKAKIFNIQKFSLHDGPGIRTSVFFSYCNLKCKWCSNPDCNLNKNTEYDIPTLMQEVLKDKAFYEKSGGGVTLTGGEIFMQYDFIKEFCIALKKAGLHIAIETSAVVELEKFKNIVELVDYVFVDCKHYDNQMHKQGTGVGNGLVIDNIKWLTTSGKKYLVRIPVIPNFNDKVEDAQGFCDLLNELGVSKVELLPFHQLGSNKYKLHNIKYEYEGVRQLYKEDLIEYKNIFKQNNIEVIVK